MYRLLTRRIYKEIANKGGEAAMTNEFANEVIALRNQISHARKQYGPISEEQKRESHIKSVYAGLALENCDVTLQKVRKVLTAS